jgi:hypothetical protein
LVSVEEGPKGESFELVPPTENNESPSPFILPNPPSEDDVGFFPSTFSSVSDVGGLDSDALPKASFVCSSPVDWNEKGLGGVFDKGGNDELLLLVVDSTSLENGFVGGLLDNGGRGADGMDGFGFDLFIKRFGSVGALLDEGGKAAESDLLLEDDAFEIELVVLDIEGRDPD